MSPKQWICSSLSFPVLLFELSSRFTLAWKWKAKWTLGSQLVIWSYFIGAHYPLWQFMHFFWRNPWGSRFCCTFFSLIQLAGCPVQLPARSPRHKLHLNNTTFTCSDCRDCKMDSILSLDRRVYFPISNFSAPGPWLQTNQYDELSQ